MKLVPYDPQLKAHAVWDLGVGQNLAIGIYQRVGAETHKIDYWQGSNKDGIPEAITALKAKPYAFAKMFVPHDAGGTESGTGKTRLATAKTHGSNVEWVVYRSYPWMTGSRRGVPCSPASGSTSGTALCDSAPSASTARSGMRTAGCSSRSPTTTGLRTALTSTAMPRSPRLDDDAAPMPAPTTNLVKPFYPGMGV